MEEKTERKKYEFYLEINSLKDHKLYLRKAGDYNDTQNEDGKTNDQEESKSNNNNGDTHGQKQKFEECWGFDNAADELKDFNTWKEAFFPTLLEKYNINKEDCKVLVKGPKAVFDFFREENYKPYFELVGVPIEELKDNNIEELLLKWYAKKEDFKSKDIRVCLANLKKDLEEDLTTKKKRCEEFKSEIHEKEKEKQQYSNKEIENQIEQCENKKNQILGDIKIIFDKENLRIRKKEGTFYDKNELKASIVLENEIGRKINSLSVEINLRRSLYNISDDFTQESKDYYENSIKQEKGGLFRKEKFSFDTTEFYKKLEDLLNMYVEKAEDAAEDCYNEKINNLREAENGKTAKIKELDEEIKSKETEVNNLNEEISKIKEFLDEYYKLINPPKQNSEETEGNNNE